jgi:hypothetical protein
VVLKRLITATAAFALMTTPVLAAGPSATPAAATNRAVNTRVENVQGMQALGGGHKNLIIITAAFVAIALGICFGVPLCKSHDNPPASP